MAEEDSIGVLSINEVFRTDEILEKILKNLDIESLCSARRCCQRWKTIIDDFTSKISKSTCLPDQKCQMYLHTFTINSQFIYVFHYYLLLNRTHDKNPNLLKKMLCKLHPSSDCTANCNWEFLLHFEPL